MQQTDVRETKNGTKSYNSVKAEQEAQRAGRDVDLGTFIRFACLCHPCRKGAPAKIAKGLLCR
jgi:hypothetical protein